MIFNTHKHRSLALRSVGPAAFALSAVLPGGCASTPAVQEVVMTRRLDLVNGAGQVIARLGADAEGSAGLFVLDEHGANRAALIHDATQTALYIFDGDGTIRIGVAQFAHGGGGVALHGEQSKGAAVMYLKDSDGTLTIYDPDGKVVEQVPDTQGQTPKDRPR